MIVDEDVIVFGSSEKDADVKGRDVCKSRSCSGLAWVFLFELCFLKHQHIGCLI